MRSLLVIEVDGGQHLESAADEARDRWLVENGFQVLRFWNHEVLQNLAGAAGFGWNHLPVMLYNHGELQVCPPGSRTFTNGNGNRVFMNFTSAIDVLRSTPIPIDTWKDIQIGENNGGPYKNNYPKMPVTDDGRDELIDVSSYGLVSSDFYMDQLLNGDRYLEPALADGYLWSRALARRFHTRLLARADAFLRANGLFLFVASAWRHPELQKLITADFATKHGADQARRMFAPAVAGQAPPPHSTGAAFDLEVWSLETGGRLEMYYTEGKRNIYNAYEMEKLALDTRRHSDETFVTSLYNRRILYHVLCTEGIVFKSDSELFSNHPGEFWHFGLGDPLSAYLSREPAARHGAIYPRRGSSGAATGSMHSPTQET